MEYKKPSKHLKIQTVTQVSTYSDWLSMGQVETDKEQKRKKKEQLNVGVCRSLERSTMEIYRIAFL